jgi:hypothetical protein
MALKWTVGSNGNLFADGPRPRGTPNFVRYCIALPHPAGAQNYALMWNGWPISDHASAADAKAAAEREAAGEVVPA